MSRAEGVNDLYQGKGRLDMTRAQTVIHAEPDEISKGFCSVPELQAELSKNQYGSKPDLSELMCCVCSNFTIAPRECSMCSKFTCNQCSINEDSEVCCHC